MVRHTAAQIKPSLWVLHSPWVPPSLAARLHRVQRWGRDSTQAARKWKRQLVYTLSQTAATPTECVD